MKTQYLVNVKNFGSGWKNVRGEYMSLYYQGRTSNFYFTEVEGQYRTDAENLQFALFNNHAQGYMDGFSVPVLESRWIEIGNGWVDLLFNSIAYCDGRHEVGDGYTKINQIISDVCTAVLTGLIPRVDNFDEYFENGAYCSPNLPDFVFGTYYNSNAKYVFRLFHIPTQKYWDM